MCRYLPKKQWSNKLGIEYFQKQEDSYFKGSLLIPKWDICAPLSHDLGSVREKGDDGISESEDRGIVVKCSRHDTAVACTNLLKLRLPALYQIHKLAGSANWTLWVIKMGVGVERQEVMKMEGGVVELQGLGAHMIEIMYMCIQLLKGEKGQNRIKKIKGL